MVFLRTNIIFKSFYLSVIFRFKLNLIMYTAINFKVFLAVTVISESELDEIS